MIAHSEWKGNSFFEGKSESGHTIHFGADPAHQSGPSPMEAILMSLCACTCVDVVAILKKKRQPLLDLKVTAAATQDETPPHVFTQIKLSYIVSGELARKTVEDAVALSLEKYCPISRMLGQTVSLGSEIVYTDDETAP